MFIRGSTLLFKTQRHKIANKMFSYTVVGFINRFGRMSSRSVVKGSELCNRVATADHGFESIWDFCSILIRDSAKIRLRQTITCNYAF